VTIPKQESARPSIERTRTAREVLALALLIAILLIFCVVVLNLITTL
jgi:hypothetical protein